MTNHLDRRGWMQSATLVAACAVAGLFGAGSAQAQDWPTKPVRIVLAIGPGSSGDTLARMMAPRLEARWKQPVIVENKPGAGGVVGTEYVVRATDGHTLLLGTQSSILPKYTQKGLRFDPLTDLVPVRKVLNYQLVIATNGETAKQARTLKELIDLSKKGSQGLFLAGLGPTSVFNLSYAILNRQLGARYSSVNFNNVNDANLAVMRNDAQFIVNNPASVRPYFATNAIVPLAAIGMQRYASLPDVPTLQEAVGYSGYLPQLWTGFFVPRNTPAALVERISQDVAAIFEEPEFRRQVEDKLTASVASSSPDAFAKDIREETTLWQDLFKSLNIQPE
ncbi:Bug family tripartite tricarboxylate transporter substrate binding protein [Xylophilus sp. ASV27]|uniref:Bug family tripartite tricarboxylate transporter substrate binding protein n=1 Tax=Xylophilus sp. ASV27 TaxID=2795129 RepID=UPI0018EACB9F|nr:tripartite tricarboxylate transporter substrate binding protein [Xylophilus sp. ASV27]